MRNAAPWFVAATLAVFAGCQNNADLEGAPLSSDSNYTAVGTCKDGLPRLDLTTAPGVCVGIAATGFKFPRGIAQAPNGDIFVADMGGWGTDLGSIWRVKKMANGKYLPQQLLTQIDKPSGIAINPKDGLVYVATPKDIFRFDPNQTPRPRLTLVVNKMPDDGRHPLKHFVFDGQNPDIIYVNVGSFSDVCEQANGSLPTPCPEEAISRAGIRKYVMEGPDRKATTFTVIARGLRNSMALAVHPKSNILLQGENSRDTINKRAPELTNQELDLPHEELNVIREGQHYGWPYCYDNGIPSPEYKTADCTGYQKPALLLPGHVAPLGMEYYPDAASARAKMFPAVYQGSLIVAYHGYREYGHRLVMVPVDANGVPGQGQPLDIIRGWEQNPGKQNPTGAPVDVLIANDGAIWLTEDKNRTLLRVSYDPAGGNGQPMVAEPPRQQNVSPEEAARCQALRTKSDMFSLVQRDVIDTNCVSCHGAGPGFPGGLALLRCDDVGNAKRLLEPRRNAGPLVTPRDTSSELLRRLKGQGYPQMPAGGLSPEAFKEVEDWVKAGAPAPR